MKGFIGKTISLMLVMAMVVTICPQMQLVNISAADSGEEPYCISVDRPVYASSQNGREAPENAVDDDEGTRWQAGNDDKNEWFYVDLGKKADIDHIYIHWEAAYAKSYEIQFSDDEETWTTVYTKGKGSSGTTDPTAMSISYEVQSVADGMGTIQANWTSVDNATYKVCIDDENTVATAPDGYKFNSHGPNQGQIKLSEGAHKLIVIALDKDTKAEAGRGEMDIEVKEGGGDKQEEQPGTDPLKQTITFDDLSAAQKQARYVKIVCTERQTPNYEYGCSFYEFQVYGTGGVVKPPENYGTNLALNQSVKCSGLRDEWWMYDENGDLKQGALDEIKAENAVDGKKNTSFTSYQGDDQWIYVDLGKDYTIGRVIVDWNKDAGKIYDVQVSSDAKNWKTIHRVLKGFAENTDNFTCYQQNVRYVKVLGYTKVESGSGIGINELSVYEYKDGDSKENETIEELPTRQIVNNANGKGSYVSGEMYNEKNKLPTFINEETIKTPIDSNSWWSSAMVQTFSNLLCSTPLKAGFSKKGLGILTATSGWVGTRKETDLGTDQSSEELRDFYVSPENLEISSAYDRVEDYGDYSVKLGLMDDNGLQMKSTIVKGSPYIYNEFCDNTVAYISGSSITDVFDGNGNVVLTNKGDQLTTDHIGFKSFDEENTKAGNDGAYYCVNVPAGTTFKVMVGAPNYKIKITFPSAKDNYMSVAAMTKKGDIDTYYKHGYAFVTDTAVDYTYDKSNSKIVTTYTATTKTMRTGFSNVTMHALFPHQWKHSSDASVPVATYTSVRGNMKAIWSNTFTTTQQFAGLLPTFATPDSDMFNSTEMIEYLNAVVASKINTDPVDDAYWEGKNVHPLAISVLMADQLGETEIKDKLLKKLKSIMVDWFNYDGGDDKCYLIYNKDWGTVYYPNSAYGANAAICDHHFTYGYFMFGAAVLATYDKQFYKDYKDMVEILVRDYADPMEPEDDGNMFCKFRAFDQYAGHSWAGGYADSDSGNNQESASEALFSWVGMYLWGEATQNQTYIDAGAYGFTTEMDAVEQYWFDYDEDNWLDEYPFQAAGQIYGASMGYGTYFGGQPVYVFGIQWLPISEYLTNYGMNQEKCAKIYQGLEDDTQYAINIEKILHQEELDKGLSEDQWWHDPDKYVTPDNGWQHITWPFLSQTDPQRAYEKFEANVTSVQTEDRANTLWFIAAMDQLGYRTTDYVVTGNIQGSVYYNKNSEKYTAQVWNPTDSTQTVTVIDKTGKTVGTAKIGSRGLVSFNIDTDKNFSLTQVATPVMKATSLTGGTVTENITGEAVFDDTQLIELSCAESGATIYYTTDGTVPTTSSNVYKDRILVSSNTTIKAVAVKNGYIDSAYNATAVVINGDTVESSENLALGKTATASSENGAEVASKAIDGDGTTRWQATTDNDADAQWIQVDLGSVQAVNSVKINWEAAYAAKYQIQVSTDGENWTTVSEENGLVGEVISNFAATKARYVRMQGVSRGTQYGYSIYEMEVYGALQAQSPTITPVSGTYQGNQTVTLSTAVKGAEIKYTLDGSEPTEDSPTYTAPFTITKSTIVKAVTYRKGMILSDPTEASIIIAGTVALNKTSAKIAIDRTVQLAAMSDETVTWTSSNTAVAAVDQTGLVTGKTPGTTVITAKTSSGKTATCTVTVTEPVHITSIELSKATMEMKNKTSETLELKINPADTTDDTTAVWESSDENVVTVNNNGTLTAKGEGEATITVTVGKFTTTCKVIVGPAATTAEMAISPKYNAALKKQVTVYPGVEEGDAKYITDGALTAGGNHCALSSGWGYTKESYAIIDLGDTYDASTIDLIAVQYKDTAENDTVLGRKYSIEYSANGVDYTTVYESDTVKAEDFDADNCVYANMIGKTGAVRYVKVYYPQTANFGIQISEIAVLSTEQNLKTIEVEMCDDPEDLIVTSDNICEITYTIQAGAEQSDYKYIVYLDGTKVSDLIDAGTYTIKNVTAGTHKVQVVSYYDKKTSAGITREVEVDDGSLKAYVDTVRNLSKGATVTVENIEAEQQEGSKNPATLVDGKISANTADVVETTWGSKTATITIDLGQAYAKDEIDEVLIAFKANNTNATAYNIEFSGDGTNYEKVIDVTGAEYKEALEDKFDGTKYTQDTVRYVKINLTGGNYNWGYQISEIAVMGTDKYMPTEAEGLVAISPEYNVIQVYWIGTNENQTYSVYIDGALKSMNVAAGTYVYNGIDGGEHTVKVVAKLNDIESKGVTTSVTVEDDSPTAPETSTPETSTPETSTPETSTPESSTPEQGTPEPGTPNVTTPNSSGVSQPTTKVSSESETTTPKIATTTSAQNVTVKVGKTKVKKATKKVAVKKAKISLKKIKGAKKYQIQISKAKKFKKKNILVKKTVKKVKFTIKSKKIKDKKKLYVRARAMKIVNGVKYYGKWSKKKKVKIK